MTEDEAKMQDCIGPPNCGWIELTPAGVYTGGRPPRRLCKGSACGMGWRRYFPTAGPEYDLNVGYCGLAGKPDDD